VAGEEGGGAKSGDGPKQNGGFLRETPLDSRVFFSLHTTHNGDSSGQSDQSRPQRYEGAERMEVKYK